MIKIKNYINSFIFNNLKIIRVIFAVPFLLIPLLVLMYLTKDFIFKGSFLSFTLNLMMFIFILLRPLLYYYSDLASKLWDWLILKQINKLQRKIEEHENFDN